MESSVTSIGRQAFNQGNVGGGKLRSVTIPDSVVSIAYAAFYKCAKLESLVIPDSVTTLDTLSPYGSRLCEGCTSLASVVIGDGVTALPKDAFKGCTSLRNVTIGSAVASWDGSAFEGSSAITTLTLRTPLVEAVFLSQTPFLPTYLSASASEVQHLTLGGEGDEHWEICLSPCPRLGVRDDGVICDEHW